MHPVKKFPSRLSLVGLDMPQHVPSQRQIRKLCAFCRGFLNPVLAKIADSCGVGLANRGSGMSLGDGDQPNGFPAAPASTARGVDAFLDPLDVVLNPYGRPPVLLQSVVIDSTVRLGIANCDILSFGSADRARDRRGNRISSAAST